jgi:deoxyribonuclease-4
MRIFLGPAGNCASAKELATAGSLKRLAELGLNAQELEFVQQVYLKHDAAVELGGISRDLGVRLSIHAPYFINLCSLEPEKIAASKKRISDSLDRAEALAAQGAVAVHPGFFQKRPAGECMAAVVEAGKELAASYPKAILGFETTGKHSAFGSFDETLEVCKAVGRKNCVPVVDFAHLYARQMGEIDFAAVLDKLLAYGHADLYCHFSGINFSEKGELNHLPISSNKPPFGELVKELKKRAGKFSDIQLICETPLLEADCLVMKEEIERQGLKLG